MAFVKLDTGILHSTLWFERDARELFITALLMAEPREITESTIQLKVETIEPTGFEVPPGWYGFVRAAGIGIIRQAGMDREAGLKALEALGSPDDESRSSDFDGRRLVRVDGGFIVLNFVKYRDRDMTTAERSRRWRQRQKEIREQQSDTVSPRRDNTASHRRDTVTDTPRHQAEAEAEAEALKNKNKTKSAHFVRPSLEEVSAYIALRKSPINPEAFFNFYKSKGWRVGGQSMKDWHAAVVTWETREKNKQQAKKNTTSLSFKGAEQQDRARKRLAGEK